MRGKLDYTALSTLERCEQEYVWRHVRHLAAPSDASAHFGQVVHVGVRALYDGVPPEPLMQAAWQQHMVVREVEAKLGGRPVKAHLTLARAIEIVHKYAEQWIAPGLMFDVVWNEGYAESATECALPDRCVRSKVDGLLYAMDLKTTGMYITPDWQRSFEQNQQVAIQLDVLEHTLKEPLAGFWLDAIHLARTGVVKQEHFSRYGPIVYSAELRAELRSQRVLKAQRAHDLERYPQAATKSTGACIRYTRLCDYFDLCKANLADREPLVQISLTRGTLEERPWKPNAR